MQLEQPVLVVDGAQNPLALRHLECADAWVVVRCRKRQLFVAADDDGARNGRQVAGLPALFVVLDELVDLLANDLPLIGLLARRDAALEQIPVDFRWQRTWTGPAAAYAVGTVCVIQHLEPDKLVDITGSQGRLVELDAELLHADRSHVDHGITFAPAGHRPATAVKERDFTGRLCTISTVFSDDRRPFRPVRVDLWA